MVTMHEVSRSPRCPFRGCPVRYRGGPDRPCPEHQHADPYAAFAAQSAGINLAARPSEQDGGDDGPAAA
jgi:hypothetical protein